MKLLRYVMLVLFDHDGTVVDSETIALESAWRLTDEVAHEFAGAQHYELNEFVKSFAGKPYREILKQIYANSLDFFKNNQRWENQKAPVTSTHYGSKLLQPHSTSGQCPPPRRQTHDWFRGSSPMGVMATN